MANRDSLDRSSSDIALVAFSIDENSQGSKEFRNSLAGNEGSQCLAAGDESLAVAVDSVLRSDVSHLVSYPLVVANRLSRLE